MPRSLTAIPSQSDDDRRALNRRDLLGLTVCGAAGIATGATATEHAKPGPTKPNFLFILSDDQAWAGTSVQMHPTLRSSKSDYYRTPNLERLAKQGMRFSDAYAPAPVCSPTRYSLQTGKTTARHGMTKAGPVVRPHPGYKLLPPASVRQIAADEITVAMLLKRQGYATAHYGKWHLGAGGPGRFGYDEHDGDTGNQDAAPHKDPNPVDIFGISRRANAFMAKSVRAGKPFYVQLSHHALHYPENARKVTLDACRKRGPDRRERDVQRAAITEDLDDGLGVVLAELDRLGLTESTYVIYMSDNGAGGRNGPLRGGKGTCWEGGLRVPFVVRGPGVKAGAFCSVPVTGCDLLPTLCDLAGLAGPLPKNVDGGSFASVLRNGGQGKVTRPARGLFFHFPHYQSRDIGPHSAIRVGGLKFVRPYETNESLLFDLSRDLSERTNLAKRMPDKAAELRKLLESRLASTGARLPKVNPSHDPTQSPPATKVRGAKRPQDWKGPRRGRER